MHLEIKLGCIEFNKSSFFCSNVMIEGKRLIMLTQASHGSVISTAMIPTTELSSFDDGDGYK